MDVEDLDELLVAAGEAPPESRIRFRDLIAAHGSSAINRLLGPAWIGDPKYAAFAIRTIGKAGEVTRNEAVDALRGVLATALSDVHRADVLSALTTLGATAPKVARASPKLPKASPKLPKASPKLPKAGETAMVLANLVVGKAYSRTELHDSLGGSRQGGISHPAIGHHCLLFSDPSTASKYGYRDSPVGADGYRFFGQWSGPGDMVLAGNNRVILDRSPELYLFMSASAGRVFLGQYRCAGWGAEETVRDGHLRQAIVFDLHRVKA